MLVFQALSDYIFMGSEIRNLFYLAIMVYYFLWVSCKNVHCFSCDKYMHSFPDINECDEGLDVCHINATCENTVGSYDCYCSTGFTGDGMNCASKYV